MKPPESTAPEAEVLLRAAERGYKKQCSFCGNTHLSQKMAVSKQRKTPVKRMQIAVESFSSL